jgi:hypothetical protein
VKNGYVSKKNINPVETPVIVGWSKALPETDGDSRIMHNELLVVVRPLNVFPKLLMDFINHICISPAST